MVDITFPLAFVSGVISFFAPCFVPLLPTYIAYISGVSLSELREKGTAFERTVIFSSLSYILGFSLVFVLLGALAGGVGSIFRQYDFMIQRIGGVFLIAFGLQFAGFLNIPFLAKGASGYRLPSWILSLGYLRPFGMGIVFATIWTPCVGVVLGSILTIAAVGARALEGAFLLFVYSLGISVPFLIVALSLAHAPRYLRLVSRNIILISRLAGLVLVILGVLFLTDTYKFVNSWILDLAFRLGYEVR